MNIAAVVEQALRAPDGLNAAIQECRQTADVAQVAGQLRCLQQLRCAARLLKRIRQFRQGQIGSADLLSIYRDFIQTVGSVTLPDWFSQLVEGHGEPFDLYANGDHVNLMPKSRSWFDKHHFVDQIYSFHEGLAVAGPPCGDALLYDATGFKSYRSPGQKAAVHTALRLPQGFTLLVSMMTGGGKSLVSQMLAAYGGGLTVVVVPTVALGLDQLRVAKALLGKGMDPRAIESLCGASQNETVASVDRVSSGAVRLLFVSPESLIRNRRLNEALLELASQNRLENLVIDEAHIVNDWGTFFRPDFQMLAGFRRELIHRSEGRLRTYLLSATLTEDVVQELTRLYSEPGHLVCLRFDNLRTEPRFIKVNATNQVDYCEKILDLCRILPKPMIIYEVRPVDANKWQSRLKDIGFTNVATFTGETQNDDRDRVVNDWSEDKIDIICATSAFGMGIDKPDVRSIIHATPPESINRFYQEVGRSGRDGIPSTSVLFTRSFDGMAEYFIGQRVLTVEKMIDRWFSMLREETVLVEGSTVLLNASTAPQSFSEEARSQAGDQNMRWNLNLLLFLKRYGLIDFANITFVAPNDTHHTHGASNTHGTYFVKALLIDPFLMQNQQRLEKVLTAFRDQEADRIRQGARQMMEMAATKGGCCVAEYFSELFPYAPRGCSGCQAHREPVRAEASQLFHTDIRSYGSLRQSAGLANITAGASSVLIERTSNDNINEAELGELFEALAKLGIATLIVPKVNPEICLSFRGVVMSVHEFAHYAKHHRSIFSGGVLCVLSLDDRLNNQLFQSVSLLEREGVTILYYGASHTRIIQEQTSIMNLVAGGVCNVTTVLGVVQCL